MLLYEELALLRRRLRGPHRRASPTRSSRLPFRRGIRARGGIAAADALCQREACEAGLTEGGNCNSAPGANRIFKAYLHGATQRAWERFDLSGLPWNRPDGVPWVASTQDIAEDGADALTALNVTLDLEYGPGFEDMAYLGQPDGDETCGSWGDATATGRGTIYNAGAGEPIATGTSSREPVECTRAERLYCLED